MNAASTIMPTKLCVTPRYLSRVINDVSGHFANDHIDLFVIAEAKQLLRNKKYTVLQQSEMLNFTSQSLFGRYFKSSQVVSERISEYQINVRYPDIPISSSESLQADFIAGSFF